MSNLSTQVLVIGGGATGLGIAWDAALRGLKVVLVEQMDLAQGTSGRYHGLLHSGGRYVISDPQTAIDCAEENAILRSIAPFTIEDTGGFFIATPADPLDYPDRWLGACQQTGVAAKEIRLSDLLQQEPLLNPRISRAFQVQDASLDSFDLSHSLHKSILDAGGRVLLRHKLIRFLTKEDRVIGAYILDRTTNSEMQLEAEIVINATGPWAGVTAEIAGLDIPMELGKGAMVAMATRPVNTVINRLKPPADGDIVVPVGTVCVLGTTDVQVASPLELEIEPWEIDLLLAEGEFMIPGLESARALRAWSGVRPLYNPDFHASDTRELTRAHAILDHKELDGMEGIISVIGGKLTTFRLMAEETVDLVCDKLEQDVKCSTRTTMLQPHSDNRKTFQLPDRLERFSRDRGSVQGPKLICECEIVYQSQLVNAMLNSEFESLDDLRRDLRLGMGPCQAAFCAYRTAGLAARITERPAPDFLERFLDERWKGMRPLAWGNGLRQMDFARRAYLELLGESKKGTQN